MSFNISSFLSQIFRKSTTSIEELPETLPIISSEEQLHLLMENLNTEQKALILQNISQISDDLIEELSIKITELDLYWQTPLFKRDDFTFILLAAVNKGVIDLNQFGSLEVFFEAQQARKFPDNQIRCFSLNQDKDHALAFNTLKNSYDLETKLPIPTSYSPFTPTISPLDFSMSTEYLMAKKKSLSSIQYTHLTQEQENIFLDLVKELPLSEQYFFTVPKTYQMGIADVISQDQMIGIKGFFTTDSDYKIIPSTGILQAYLKAKFGDSCCELQVRLGEASPQKIRERFKDKQHDLGLAPQALGFQNVKADSVPAWGEHFYLHDFYHAFLISSIPPHPFQTLLNLCENIRSIAKEETNQKIKEVMYSLAWSLVDCEHMSYLQEEQQTIKSILPLSNDSIHLLSVLERSLFKTSLLKKGEPNQDKQEVKERRFLLLNSTSMKKVFSIFLDNQGITASVEQAYLLMLDHENRRNLDPSMISIFEHILPMPINLQMETTLINKLYHLSLSKETNLAIKGNDTPTSLIAG